MRCGLWRVPCALALALGTTGCTMWLADFFMYHPSRGLARNPGEVGLVYEDAWLTAEDRVRLHGWFVPAAASATSAPTLLWLHGNAGNIGDRLETLALIHQRLGMSCLLFDYRGYGQSAGSPSEKGLYRDARAALAYLRRHPQVRPDRIIYLGQSLGGAVAVELTSREPPRGLILEAPFTSLRAMGEFLFPYLPVSLLVRNRFDSLARIPRVRVPLLILHGDRDEVVPFAQGEALFRAASEPKTFLRIPGGGHSDLPLTGGAAYFEGWERFLHGLERAAHPPAGTDRGAS